MTTLSKRNEGFTIGIIHLQLVKSILVRSDWPTLELHLIHLDWFTTSYPSGRATESRALDPLGDLAYYSILRSGNCIAGNGPIWPTPST